MRKDEEKIQIQLAEWLVLRYPNVMFRCDLGGVRMPMGTAKKAKRMQGGRKSWPDLFIAEPRGRWKGLFLEIKAFHDDLFTKKGELRESVHIQEQSHILNALWDRGYAARFAVGFDGAKKEIQTYLEIAEG